MAVALVPGADVGRVLRSLPEIVGEAGAGFEIPASTFGSMAGTAFGESLVRALQDDRETDHHDDQERPRSRSKSGEGRERGSAEGTPSKRQRSHSSTPQRSPHVNDSPMGDRDKYGRVREEVLRNPERICEEINRIMRVVEELRTTGVRERRSTRSRPLILHTLAKQVARSLRTSLTGSRPESSRERLRPWRSSPRESLPSKEDGSRELKERIEKVSADLSTRIMRSNSTEAAARAHVIGKVGESVTVVASRVDGLQDSLVRCKSECTRLNTIFSDIHRNMGEKATREDCKASTERVDSSLQDLREQLRDVGDRLVRCETMARGHVIPDQEACWRAKETVTVWYVIPKSLISVTSKKKPASEGKTESEELAEQIEWFLTDVVKRFGTTAGLNPGMVLKVRLIETGEFQEICDEIRTVKETALASQPKGLDQSRERIYIIALAPACLMKETSRREKEKVLTRRKEGSGERRAMKDVREDMKNLGFDLGKDQQNVMVTWVGPGQAGDTRCSNTKKRCLSDEGAGKCSAAWGWCLHRGLRRRLSCGWCSTGTTPARHRSRTTRFEVSTATAPS